MVTNRGIVMRKSDRMVEMVRLANPGRNPTNIRRRLLKVLEELGETSEACLSVSSPHNYKNKTWLDYREESADTLIVLIDIALTDLTNYPGASLISPAITMAADHGQITLDDLYDAKFAIAGAVFSASHHLSDNDPMGFFGSIMRGIDAAAKMAFSPIPEDHDHDEIEDRVFEIFERKIAKWNASRAQYAATDDGLIPMFKHTFVSKLSPPTPEELIESERMWAENQPRKIAPRITPRSFG